MKFIQMKFYGVLLVTGLFCAVTQAAGISSTDIPAGSNWYIHVNLELIRNSEAGRQFVLDTVDEALGDIKDDLGIDIANEIYAVTVFGTELPLRTGAMLLHGAISSDSQARLLTVLEREGADVSTSFHGSLAYYSVAKGDGKLTYANKEGHVEDASFGNSDDLYFSFGDRQILVTHDEGLVHAFLDAGGHLGGLESANAGALVVLQAERPLLQGGADTTVNFGERWNSSILRNVDAVALVIAENAGGIEVNLELRAATEEVAMSVRNIAEGLVALKALDDDNEVLSEVLRSVRFESEGAVLRVNIPVAADQFEALKGL